MMYLPGVQCRRARWIFLRRRRLLHCAFTAAGVIALAALFSINWWAR